MDARAMAMDALRVEAWKRGLCQGMREHAAHPASEAARPVRAGECRLADRVVRSRKRLALDGRLGEAGSCAERLPQLARAFSAT